MIDFMYKLKRSPSLQEWVAIRLCFDINEETIKRQLHHMKSSGIYPYNSKISFAEAISLYDCNHKQESLKKQRAICDAIKAVQHAINCHAHKNVALDKIMAGIVVE